MCQFVSVFVALAVFGATVFAESKDDLKNYDPRIGGVFEKCKLSTGVTDDHFKSMFDGDVPLKGKAGCFLACAGKEFELVKANNMFDKDKINKFMEPYIAGAKEKKMDGPINELKKVIDVCIAAQQGDDACAIGKNFGECISVGMKNISSK